MVASSHDVDLRVGERVRSAIADGSASASLAHALRRAGYTRQARRVRSALRAIDREMAALAARIPAEPQEPDVDDSLPEEDDA